MRNLAIALAIVLTSCATPSRVYDIDMTLHNGKKITKQYELPDSVTFHIKERKGDTFLIYREDSLDCPVMIRKNVKSFKILRNGK